MRDRRTEGGGRNRAKFKRVVKNDSRKRIAKDRKIKGSFELVRCCPSKSVSPDREFDVPAFLCLDIDFHNSSIFIPEGMNSRPVVVDGSLGNMTAIPSTYRRGSAGPCKLDVLSVRNRDLHRVYPSRDPERGLMFVYQDEEKPDGVVGTFAFAVLPRNRSSQALPFHRGYFFDDALRTFLGIQSSDSTKVRGKKRHVFFDEPATRVQDKDCYPCVGPKARRNAKGVARHSRHATASPVAYDGVAKLVGLLENVWHEFVPRDEVCRVEAAFELCPWPTLEGLSEDPAQRRIFSGANLSSGCYHNAHTDADFEYTAMFTFDPWGKNSPDSNEIVRWFAFPR